jgi:hypothetical protein
VQVNIVMLLSSALHAATGCFSMNLKYMMVSSLINVAIK